MKHVAEQFEIKFVNHSFKNGNIVHISPLGDDDYHEFIGEVIALKGNDFLLIQALDTINGKDFIPMVCASQCKLISGADII